MALRLGIVGALGRDIGRFRGLFLDGVDELLCRERLSARLVILFLLDVGFDAVAQIGKIRVDLHLPLALCGLLDLFPKGLSLLFVIPEPHVPRLRIPFFSLALFPG